MQTRMAEAEASSARAKKMFQEAEEAHAKHVERLRVSCVMLGC